MEKFTIYLQNNNYSSVTIKEYQRQVGLFENWHTGEAINCQKKDILNYLAYLKNTKKIEAISRNNALIPLRHYFEFLLKQNQIATNPTTLIKLRGLKRRKLHHIYKLEELTQLTDDYYQLEVKEAAENLELKANLSRTTNNYLSRQRNYQILQFLVHQGLRTREILELQIDDLQLNKATVNIPKGSTRGNQRILPLHATQIGTLMHYLNEVRPQLVNQDSSLLFLPTLQKHLTPAKSAKTAIIKLSNQLKTLDTNFSTLAQLRASVITYWIKTYGLRKAQYFAGHKSIVSTEEYLPNDIEELAEDITKFNPF